jgi:hypothetical protein
MMLLAAIAAGYGATTPARAQYLDTSLVRRIEIVTVAGPDLAGLEAAYTKSLGYVTRERGKISRAKARSWGASRMAGRPYVMMSSTGSPDMFIRCVEIDPVPGYRPASGTGWNSYEFQVDDLDALRKTLGDSSFQILQEPHFFGGTFATAAAMSVIGPAQEVLYLASEKGDRQKSTFHIPKSQVDRAFAVILTGSDLKGMSDFYAQNLKMNPAAAFKMPIRSLQQGLGLPPEHVFDMTIVFAAQKNNMIEIDGLPAGIKPRPTRRGQIPPGNSIVSFGVKTLDVVKVKFLAPPIKLYGDRRAASILGPAGEIVELIEEPRN